MSTQGSKAFQVTQAFNAIFVPGESRHAAKETGEAEGHIYSISTMQTYVARCTRFAEWARDTHGVRDIRALTPEHANAYLDELGRAGRAGGYLGCIQSAIKKMALALHGEKWDLQRGWHSDPHPERAYASSDAPTLIADVRARERDPQTADVAQLQFVAGLRVSESTHLRGQDIDIDKCTVCVKIGSKGGKPREVKVDAEHRAFLQAMRDQGLRRSDGYVFKDRGSLDKRTESAINATCKRLKIADCGTHGFRKAWAQKRYADYLRAGMEDHAARLQLARDLGHGRVEVLKHYLND